MLTIAYIGNYRHSHCTECHVSKTLQSLGCDVIQYQEDQYSAEQILASLPPSTDLILWSRTWGLRDKGGEMIIRAAPCVTAALSLDLYVGLERQTWIDEHPWWRSTHVFTADGGHEEFWKQRGINHHWLPAAVYDKECYLAEPIEKYSADVAFVGVTRSYHREWPYRMRLLEWLRSQYGTRFLKIGFPLVSIRNNELNELYASVKIAIGDTLCLGFQHPNYWSDRVYETTGRGGFIIHPFVPGMEKHFENGRHLVFYQYGNFEQLRELIDYYLKHDDEREKIRLAGHLHTRTNHTYRHRMRELLATVFPGLEIHREGIETLR